MDAMGLDTAGAEYVHAVIKLYRTGKYFCEKEVLAKKFLEHSLEAGMLITEVGESADAAGKVAIAGKAMDELKKSLFILKIMKEEGYYPERLITPVTAVADRIKTSLSIYIPQSGVLPSLDPYSGAGLTDPGGFNDIYKGY